MLPWILEATKWKMCKTQFEYFWLRAWEGLMDKFCKWCIRVPYNWNRGWYCNRAGSWRSPAGLHINLLIATSLGGLGKASERQGEEAGNWDWGQGHFTYKYESISTHTLTTSCISALEERHFWNSPISENVWNHVKIPPTYSNVQKDPQPP